MPALAPPAKLDPLIRYLDGVSIVGAHAEEWRPPTLEFAEGAGT